MNYLLQMYLNNFYLIKLCLIYFLLFALLILILHKTAWSKMYSSVTKSMHQVFMSVILFVFKFVLVTSSLISFHTFTKSYYLKGPKKTSEIVTKLLATSSEVCSKKNVVTYHMKSLFKKVQNLIIKQSQQFYIQIKVFKQKFEFFIGLKKYQNPTQLLVTFPLKTTQLNPMLKKIIQPTKITFQNSTFFNFKHLNAFFGIKSKQTQFDDTTQSLVTVQMNPCHEMTGVSSLIKPYFIENKCVLWRKPTPFFTKQIHFTTFCKQLDISIYIKCFLTQTYHLKDATLLLHKAQSLCDTIHSNSTTFSLDELMQRLIHGLLAQDNYYLCSCAFLCVLKSSDIKQEQQALYVELFTQLLKHFFFSSNTCKLKVITQETIQLFLNLVTEQRFNNQTNLLSVYSNEIFTYLMHCYKKKLEECSEENVFRNSLVFCHSLIRLSHCGVFMNTEAFHNLILTYMHSTERPYNTIENKTSLLRKTLYDLLKETRRCEKVSENSRYICHVLNILEQISEKACFKKVKEEWKCVENETFSCKTEEKNQSTENMKKSLLNFSFQLNKTPLRNTKECEKELEGVLFQNREEETPCLSNYKTNNLLQEKNQCKETTPKLMNSTFSKDILKNSFNLSPGSTTSTDVPMSLTSFPGTTDTHQETLRHCESSIPLESFLIKSCLITDLDSAHQALKVFTENSIHHWTLTEKQNLHTTFLSMFHQFILHGQPENVSKLVQLIENFYCINAEIYEIAIKFFCYATLLNQAGFYVFRLILWIDNHVDKTQCDEEKYLSFFQKVVTEPITHAYKRKEEDSTNFTPNIDCRVLLPPSSEPSTPYLALFRSLVWYITMLIKNGNKREAFHFIFVRMKFLQNYPRLIAWIFYYFLKIKSEKDILRCIFNIFMTYTPCRFETSLQEQQCRKNIAVNASIFMALCEACIRQKDIQMLLTLLDKFKNSWYKFIQPDGQTWSMFIKALGIHKRIDECRWIFFYLTQAQQLERCEVAYGCFLDALINNNKMAEAVEIFEKLKREGSVCLNTIMFSTIAKGYAQGKQLDNALKIHQEMKDLGISINTVTYNTLVDACARVGAIDKAADLLQDMIQCNIEPDLITFSTVAKGYCVKGDVTQAIKLLDAMQQRGISPDGILYNSLLDGCVKASRLDLCQEIWKRMQNNQIAPSNFTLTILIKMFGRIGNLQQAFLLVHELPKRYGFQINAHVYTCLMSACIANKEYCKSVEVFECMKKDGVQADSKTYETALTGILRSGKYEYGLILVRDAFRLDNFHQQSFYSSVSFHGKSEYKKKQCMNPTLQHSSYPIPGLSMNPYNILMLWNQLKKNYQFQNEVYETIRDLQKIHGLSISKFLPDACNGLKKNNRFY